MTSRLAGFEPVGDAINELADLGGYGYAFSDGETTRRTLWVERGTTDVTVETDGPLTVTSMTGETTTLEPVDGEVYLTISEDPIYVTGSVDGYRSGAPASLSASPAGGGSTTVSVGGQAVTVEGEAVAAGEETIVRGTLDARRRVVGTLEENGAPVGRLVAEARPSKVTATLDDSGPFTGLDLWVTGDPKPDGPIVASLAGRKCWLLDADQGRSLVWGDLDERALYNTHGTVPVTFEYYDAGGGSFAMQYDAHGDPDRGTRAVSVEDSGEWKSATLELEEPKFTNYFNGGHSGEFDFRFGIWTPCMGKSSAPVCIGSISVGEGATLQSVLEPSSEPTEPSTSSPPETARKGPRKTAAQTTSGYSPGLGVLVALSALVLAMWTRRAI
jgi:hypothetical protein